MRAIWGVLSVLFIASLLGMLNEYSKVSFPPLGDVTEIVIKDQNQIIKRITSPIKTADIIKFVDGKRQGWYTPLAGVPSPKITLGFYNNAEFKGTFGIGSNFFYTQREGTFEAKSATDEEIQYFLYVLGVEKKRLFRNFGEIDPNLPTPE
ncbi:MAG TPA: hypothetical protein VFZ34_13120 [Blastocatellia bacterium]|nr:hypothetical protein [Blastocatellia bacterium]